MRISKSVLSGIIFAGMIAGASSVFAQSQNRTPSGHSYSPNAPRLPALNSRRDRINSRADIYESAITRSNRETAITFGNMRIFSSGDFLQPGSSNRPRY